MRAWGAAVLGSLVIPICAVAETPPAAASASKPDTSSPSQPAEASDGPCLSLVTSAETLYQQQQFEAAAVVVKQGLASCRPSPAALARLYVLDGVLTLELSAEVEARGAFAAGLAPDAATKFPEFASPRARGLFDAVKAKQAERALLPQASSVHLLDTAAVPAGEGLAAKGVHPVLVGLRITAEVGLGAVLGIAGGLAGIILVDGHLDIFGGNSSASALVAFIGLEVGELLGVGLAGFGLGARGNVWRMLLGQLIGLLVAAPLLLIPPLIPMILVLPMVGSIIALETSPENQAPSAPPPSAPPPGRATAALTIHF